MPLHWLCTLCLLEALGSFVPGVIGWRRGLLEGSGSRVENPSCSLCAVAKEANCSSQSTWTGNRPSAEKIKIHCDLYCGGLLCRGRRCSPWIGLSAVVVLLRWGEEGLKLGGETGAFFSSLGLLFKTTIFLPPSPLRSTNLAPPALSSFGPFDIFLGLAAQLLFPTNPVSFRNFFKMADEVSHVPRLHGRSLGRREAPRTGWRENPAMPIRMAQIGLPQFAPGFIGGFLETRTHLQLNARGLRLPHTIANSMAPSTTSSRPRPLAMPVPRPPTPCSALLCGRTGLS